jgi:hypothetical protein
MKLIYNQCFDDEYLGDIEVLCDCGTINHYDCESVGDKIKCSHCGKEAIIKSELRIWLEEFKGGE